MRLILEGWLDGYSNQEGFVKLGKMIAYDAMHWSLDFHSSVAASDAWGTWEISAYGQRLRIPSGTPSGVRFVMGGDPEVSAALEAPANFWQPSGVFNREGVVGLMCYQSGDWHPAQRLMCKVKTIALRGPC